MNEDTIDLASSPRPARKVFYATPPLAVYYYYDYWVLLLSSYIFSIIMCTIINISITTVYYY